MMHHRLSVFGLPPAKGPWSDHQSGITLWSWIGLYLRRADRLARGQRDESCSRCAGSSANARQDRTLAPNL